LSIGVVIILYHPDIAHIQETLSKFKGSPWHIVLVDNSPTLSSVRLLPNSEIIHFSNNIGIAEAQNVGLRQVFSNGASHALLLDQDSQFDGQSTLDLFNKLKSLEKECSAAAIGPSIRCEFTNRTVAAKLHKGEVVRNDVECVPQLIASGMLLSASAFFHIGEKESSLFIDGVDHEWCWRARSKGYFVFQSRTVCMAHRQGDDRVNVLGITFKQGAPIRLYYQFRNVLILMRRSYVPTYWKCRHFFAIPLRYIVNRYVMPEGKSRGRFMRQGLRDGIKKNMGAYTK